MSPYLRSINIDLLYHNSFHNKNIV